MKKGSKIGFLLLLCVLGLCVLVFGDTIKGQLDNAQDDIPVPGEGELVCYENATYGFRFSLPETWKGYSVVEDKWSSSPDGTYSGPVIKIRHPSWTAEAPRQDIPIMVISLNQWSLLQEGKFNIGAAPVGPAELGPNNKWVFALPARYNYEFLEGYEEVEQILESDPLVTFDVPESGISTSPSLGGICLGDSPDKVLSVLGDAYKETTEPDEAGYFGEDLIVWRFESGIDVTLGQNSGKVLRVAATSPDFPTDLGVSAGDEAGTALTKYRALYEEVKSRHYDKVLEGWFLLDEQQVIILDFDASDGSLVNSELTPDSRVEQIILGYWAHFD